MLFRDVSWCFVLCFSFCEILLCWNVLVSPFGHFDIFLPRVARKALAEWRLFHVSTKHSCSTHVCLSCCTSLWEIYLRMSCKRGTSQHFLARYFESHDWHVHRPWSPVVSGSAVSLAPLRRQRSSATEPRPWMAGHSWVPFFEFEMRLNPEYSIIEQMGINLFLVSSLHLPDQLPGVFARFLWSSRRVSGLGLTKSIQCQSLLPRKSSPDVS